MKSLRCPALAFALLLVTTPAAQTWDQKGHRVTAAIAWDHMDPGTRTKAAAILRAAPADSGLLDEDAGSTLPQPERDRALFLRASTWPDLVRSTAHPARRAKYHRGPWHYVNIFWQERARRPIERRDLPREGQLIARLAQCDADLRSATSGATPELRAITLAWFEHLVGDIHQPLHVTARITPFEKQGDHGGNDFCLGKTHPLGDHDCSSNLHALWDDILTTPHGRGGGGE